MGSLAEYLQGKGTEHEGSYQLIRDKSMLSE